MKSKVKLLFLFAGVSLVKVNVFSQTQIKESSVKSTNKSLGFSIAYYTLDKIPAPNFLFRINQNKYNLVLGFGLKNYERSPYPYFGSDFNSNPNLITMPDSTGSFIGYTNHTLTNYSLVKLNLGYERKFKVDDATSILLGLNINPGYAKKIYDSWVLEYSLEYNTYSGNTQGRNYSYDDYSGVPAPNPTSSENRRTSTINQIEIETQLYTGFQIDFNKWASLMFLVKGSVDPHVTLQKKEYYASQNHKEYLEAQKSLNNSTFQWVFETGLNIKL